MNPAAFREINSTYYVNRRRKEAIIEPLQRIITNTIEPQLAQIHSFRNRVKLYDNFSLRFDHTTPPTLQDISLEALFREQEVTLQEIRAQTERAIEVILADTEDIDPLSTDWSCQAITLNNQGQNLIEKPTVYLPLDFIRCRDLSGQTQSIPLNPSEYLPSDEAYFEASGALEPPFHVAPSNLSYLDTNRTRSYSTKDADPNTNKFYCHLDPPPPVSNQSLSLPNSGETFLRDGSPYFKKLDKGDIIYIPDQRKFGKIISWRFGLVSHQPLWIFSNHTSTYEETDHWVPILPSEPPETIPFGSFVIKITSTHPTRRLLAYVSPYTASDSSFLN